MCHSQGMVFPPQLKHPQACSEIYIPGYSRQSILIVTPWKQQVFSPCLTSAERETGQGWHGAATFPCSVFRDGLWGKFFPSVAFHLPPSHCVIHSVLSAFSFWPPGMSSDLWWLRCLSLLYTFMSPLSTPCDLCILVGSHLPSSLLLIG